MVRIKDRWLSAGETGKYLGVSSDIVCRVCRGFNKHATPAHRLGRLWKFKKDEMGE